MEDRPLDATANANVVGAPMPPLDTSMPGWVKVSAAIVAGLVALFVLLHLAGVGGHGGHGHHTSRPPAVEREVHGL